MSIRYFMFALLNCCLLSSTVYAEESEADAELLKAVATLDEAFSKRDKETIRSMTDPMHISISPSYQFFTQEAQLKTLPELKLTFFKASPKIIVHPTPRTALIRYEANIEGTFEGKTLAKHVQILESWVKKKGKWIETSYQETPLP
ncbi:nuclear transport factor 2 family protein [Gimesia sp.]|uniref:nuclear transport factor 2 family protein n=1 Tax=Gimesia sp. TaxID=2024833 RepID=UPI003A93C056